MALTVHHALVELKTLDKRIQRALKEKFVGYIVGEEGLVAGYKDNKDFEKDAKANLESVEGLIKRRNLIKKLIIASNATTTVKIGEDEMTVAAAIDRKDAISYEKNLYETLRMQYANVQREVQNAENTMNHHIEARTDGMNGATKVSKKEREEIEGMVERRYKPTLIDPIDIAAQMKALIKQIEDFESQVDAALSVSNATTTINLEG